MSRVSFTGNRDLDVNLLISLPDEDLLRACQTNKYVSSLCKLEVLWNKKTQKRFGRTTPLSGKTWRQTYREMVLSEPLREKLFKVISGSMSLGLYPRVRINSPEEIFEQDRSNFLSEQRRILGSLGYDRLVDIDRFYRLALTTRIISSPGWGYDYLVGFYLERDGGVILMPADL